MSPATEFILAWISGPWAPLAIVALFLAASLAFAAYMAPFEFLGWFIQRGLRRRRERLAGWSKDSTTMTDLEMESLR